MWTDHTCILVVITIVLSPVLVIAIFQLGFVSTTRNLILIKSKGCYETRKKTDVNTKLQRTYFIQPNRSLSRTEVTIFLCFCNTTISQRSTNYSGCSSREIIVTNRAPYTVMTNFYSAFRWTASIYQTNLEWSLIQWRNQNKLFPFF